MTLAIGFMGCVAVLMLLAGNAVFAEITDLPSLPEPVCMVLTGVGFLLAAHVSARLNRPTDPKPCSPPPVAAAEIAAGVRIAETMGHAKLVSRACLTLLACVLMLSCAKDPEAAKRAYLKSGDAYFAEQKFKEAVVEYRNAVHQDPRFGEAHYKLAEAYVRDSNLAGAYREYIRAADLMPGNLDAQLDAGSMLLLNGQFEDAKNRADGILAATPQNVPAHVLRGNALAAS